MHPGQDAPSLRGQLRVSSHPNVPAFWILGAVLRREQLRCSGITLDTSSSYLPLLSDYRGVGRSAGGKTSGSRKLQTTGTTGTPSAPVGRRQAEELIKR